MHGQQCRAVRAVLQLDVGRAVIQQPLEVLGRVAGVHHHHEVVFEAVDQQVVHDPAVRATHRRVDRLPRRCGGQVVGHSVAQELERARTLDVELAHVRDVEQAGALAHAHVLAHVAGVAHRHLETRELHDLGAQRAVEVVERGAF